MKKILKEFKIPMLTNISLYIIQFLILPAIYEIFTVVHKVDIPFFLPVISLTLVVMFFFSSKLRFWIPSLIPYTALMFIYTPPGIYGIGMRMQGLFSHVYDPESRWFGIIVVLVFFALTQLLVWFFVKILRFLLKSRHKSH